MINCMKGVMSGYLGNNKRHISPNVLSSTSFSAEVYFLRLWPAASGGQVARNNPSSLRRRSEWPTDNALGAGHLSHLSHLSEMVRLNLHLNCSFSFAPFVLAKALWDSGGQWPVQLILQETQLMDLLLNFTTCNSFSMTEDSDVPGDILCEKIDNI